MLLGIEQNKQRAQIICADWLRDRGKNVYSQFGEDGLIAAVFEKIGTTNKWCFEAGAYDGKTLSNVRALIEQGWRAALVEQDSKLFRVLSETYHDNDCVRCEKAYLEPWSVDGLLERLGVPWDCDLGVLDIDEQEFWVWSGMHYTHPRVMLVEYALGRPMDQIPPLRLDKGEPIPATQAGRNMIIALGLCKGYQCVALTECNALFVINEALTGV